MQISQRDKIIEVVFDVSLKTTENQIEKANELSQKISQIYQDNQFQRFSLLLDISKDNLYIGIDTMETVKIYEKIVDNDQTYRMAILGKKSFADPIIEVAFSRIAKKKVRWFTEKDKALWWLGVKQ